MPNNFNMHIVVSGANGQIGSELRMAKNTTGLKIHAYRRNQLDICNTQQVESILKKHRPKYFMNAAAYTQVDKAEDEIQEAYNINANALIDLSLLCNRYNCCLIHYSTDYVYNPKRQVALTENDKTSPKGIYADSKRLGEKNIEALCDNYIIIRTSWVYSKYGKNFVDTMLRLAKTRKTLQVVNDQIGAPTHAKDIAEASLRIIQSLSKNKNSSIQEIYNYSNAGVTNWADFARKIFSLTQQKCTVQNISTKAYDAKAYRPAWSVLSSAKIAKAYKLDIPLWEKSLNDYLTSTGNIEAK